MVSPARCHDLTWDDLVVLEPRLRGLAAVAATLHPSDEAGWAFRVKPALRALVGFEADKPEAHPLASSRAYVVAYDYLLALWEGA